jgi:hypothetical protein
MSIHIRTHTHAQHNTNTHILKQENKNQTQNILEQKKVRIEIKTIINVITHLAKAL